MKQYTDQELIDGLQRLKDAFLWPEQTQFFQEVIDRLQGRQPESDSVTPPTRSDGEGWVLAPPGWAVDRFRIKDRPSMGDVFLENTGNGKWSVFNNPDVLNKKGKWEYQPMPSARDDNFIQRCRFDSAQEAADAFAARPVKVAK